VDEAEAAAMAVAEIAQALQAQSYFLATPSLWKL
jgi:hypothetical protein